MLATNGSKEDVAGVHTRFALVLGGFFLQPSSASEQNKEGYGNLKLVDDFQL